MGGRGNVPDYTPGEIDKSLMCLIVHGGNAKRSAAALKDAGMDNSPTEATLRFWMKAHADRYAELSRDYAPLVAEKVAAEAERLALKLTEAEDAVADRILARIDEIEPRDLSRAIRDLSTSKALQIDKLSSPLRGRPTVIVSDHRDGADILRSLAERIPGLILDAPIDSTAIEIQSQHGRPDLHEDD